MARVARCPSCGATVEFKSIVSVLAVCDYCQSTLVREGKEIADLGKMAALIEDRSPLQRGAEGRWHGLHFALIGRIQYRYDAGLWNEWHLLFDNGRSGWLSEAGGEYVLSMPRGVTEALPAFETLRVGDVHKFDGVDYRITNILTAECVAGEGELPFKVGAGYTAPVVDLRNAAGGFATLDYSDDPARPLLFVGESVPFKSLAWANLREKIPIAAVNAGARAFGCPSCGAPLTVSHGATLSVGCGSCGAVIDTAHETVQLIAKAKGQIEAIPWLAPGAKGKLRGEELEVVGYLARRTAGGDEVYRWNEWVLLASDGSTRWLTEYDGHWNFGRVLARALQESGMKVAYDGQDYKHFLTYGSAVDFVVGEFPWQVKIDEEAMVEDYIAPPRMLSHEVTDREETWTLLEYVDAAEVRQAFAVEAELPSATGIYANQVNPYAAGHALVCSRFWKFAVLATAVHLALLWGSGGTLLTQSLLFDAAAEEPQTTREFRLESALPRLDIEHDTNVANNWLSLGVTLVNKDSGEAWQATREISHYEGFDDGESWSEGSRSDVVTFTDLPAGTYVLAEEAELGAAVPVAANVKVSRAGPRWSTYFLLLAGLALFPIYTRIRRYGFESKRWAESDHPHVYGSGSDRDSSDSGDGDGGGDGGGGDGGGGGD